MTVEHSGRTVIPQRMPRPDRLALLIVGIVFALVACGGDPGRLFDDGPYTSDFFDAQAHALVNGRLDVPPEVAGLEGFVHDGRTQLYFGIVPALARVPIVAFTDALDGRLTIVSMIAAVVVAAWAAGAIARHLRPRDPTDGDEWAIGAWMVLVGLGSPLLFLAARPVVYHETELWGTAVALLALLAILRWRAAPSGTGLVIASAAATVALSTRASVGAGALAALGLVALGALVRRAVPWRSVGWLALAVVVPLVPYVAINVARFDSAVSIPFDEQVFSQTDPARQATLDATDGTLFGPEFAPTALVAYLRPDGIALQRLYPFVTFRESSRIVGDPTFDTVDRTASLPVVAPVLVLFAGIGAVALARRRRPHAPGTVPATIGTGIGLASTVTIAFIAQRYLADFTPTLVLLGSVGLWRTVDALATRRARVRRGGVTVLAIVALGGVMCSTALAVQARAFFILPETADRLALVTQQYDLAARLPGPDAPGVRTTDEIGDPGPRGDTVILDRCRGLYWSDGSSWWPLELGGPDALVLVDPLAAGVPEATEVLAGTATWQLVTEPALLADGGAGVQLRYRNDDGVERSGPVLDPGQLVGVDVRIDLDRVNAEVTVRAGDTEVLRAWLVDLRGEVTVATDVTVDTPATPLCDRLLTRLED